MNDQASLLAPADAKKLESGLRRYADNTGTQIVVVTVPTLGGRSVADYGRALGTAWGVGQRDKNNGVVVLISAQEHQVTIQPGSGLASTITPAVTSRVISRNDARLQAGQLLRGPARRPQYPDADGQPGLGPADSPGSYCLDQCNGRRCGRSRAVPAWPIESTAETPSPTLPLTTPS